MREIVMVTSMRVKETFYVEDEDAEKTLREYENFKYIDQELSEYITALGADNIHIIDREAVLI